MRKNAITYISELVVKMMTLYTTLYSNLPNSYEKKVLGVIIDSGLKFDPHIKSMCKKAVQTLRVLNIISSLLDPEKKKLVFNAAIKSHFSSCPLIWMLVLEVLITL